MSKVDLKAEMRNLYKPSAKAPKEVEVPELQCVKIAGSGDPSTCEEYSDAVSALFAVSYGLKSRLKETAGKNYTVMPLETISWLPGSKGFDPDRKSDLRWVALIVQPDEVTQDVFEEVREEVMSKKDVPALAQAELGTLDGGRAAQMLHVGSYADEDATIEKVHQFIAEQGGSPEGKHHEIYLNDPSRTDPDKLKTVIRQPFEASGGA